MNHGIIHITGASPDSVNNNRAMRDYVVEGFEAAAPSAQVKNIRYEDVIASLLRDQPRLLVIFGSCMPDESSYFALRKAADKTKTIMTFWLHDDPYEFDMSSKVTPYADFIFSNDKWAALHYDGKPAHHLPMAASPKAHFREVDSTHARDLFFCGVGFPNRTQLIADLKHVLEKYRTEILGDSWENYSFARNTRIPNQNLPDYYNSSKFVLNIGRHFNLRNERYSLDPTTPGPRTFEAAMAGCVQLFHVESLEIEEYYLPRKEILLFDTVKSFKDHIERLIDDPAGIAEIAKSAQKRTLEEHCYRNRAMQILSVVQL